MKYTDIINKLNEKENNIKQDVKVRSEQFVCDCGSKLRGITIAGVVFCGDCDKTFTVNCKKMKNKIKDIFKNNAMEVDNWNNAIFQEQFDNITDLILELVNDSQHNVKVLMPHDTQIEDAIDKLLIIRGEHPTRVRNALYGEERQLAMDVVKYVLLNSEL